MKTQQPEHEKQLVLRLTPFFYYPRPRNGWPIRFDPVGGIQLQVWQETMLAREHGLEQIILTLGMKGASRYWHLDKHTIIQTARVPWPPIYSETEGTWQLVSSWGIATLLWVLRNSLGRSSIRHHIKLVHCHCDGSLWPLWVGPLVAHWAKSPLIFTVHCSRLATYEPMTKFAALYQPYAQSVECKALSQADHVITLTQRTADIYVNRGVISRDHVRVIPDIVDKDRFRVEQAAKQKDTLRQRFQIPEDKHIVLYLGRIAHEKGWIYLVRAAAALKRADVHFVFCGDGPQRPRLEQALGLYGQRERTTVTGFISFEDVPSMYSLATLFVLPSIYEELGSSLLEAMSAGLPIIATKAGGIPNIIKNGYNGILVPAQSPEELTRAIGYLLDDPVLARKLARQGHQYVQERFDPRVKIANTLSVYEKVGFRL